MHIFFVMKCKCRQVYAIADQQLIKNHEGDSLRITLLTSSDSLRIIGW